MTDADFLRSLADRLGTEITAMEVTLEERGRLYKIAGDLELVNSFLDSEDAEQQRIVNENLKPGGTDFGDEHETMEQQDERLFPLDPDAD